MAAFKEYFPDESLAEKFLRKPGRHDQAPSKGILNFGNTLFELDYGKEGVPVFKDFEYVWGKE